MTEITQADKARFRGWYRSTGTRSLDWWFARHREQAEQETVAKIVAWLRDEVEAHPVTEYASFAAAIACSIEAREWK